MPAIAKDAKPPSLESQRARFEAISNAFEGRLRDYERKGLGGLLASGTIGAFCVWYYVHSTGDASVLTPAYWAAAAQVAYVLVTRVVLGREVAQLRRLQQALTADGSLLVLTNHSRGRDAQLARKMPEDAPDRVVRAEALASVRAYGRFLRRTEL